MPALTADMTTPTETRTAESPYGPLLVVASPAGITRVAFPHEDHDRIRSDIDRCTTSPPAADHAAQAARQLEEYFAGGRSTFDVDLDLGAVFWFRRRVLEHLRTVPYATTTTYGAVAAAIGSGRAVRAVGTSCAKNPLPILIGCHRVLRQDGTPGRYLGGDDVKVALLTLEAGH